MANFPDIEKIQKDVIKLLERFSTTHDDFVEENKTNKQEYTKQLRKIYNKINNEIDKLRLYNNEVEKNNRDENMKGKYENEFKYKNNKIIIDNNFNVNNENTNNIYNDNTNINDTTNQQILNNIQNTNTNIIDISNRKITRVIMKPTNT